ncbi:GNAT family N-acetyltransferase [Thalassotalea montiporae]
MSVNIRTGTIEEVLTINSQIPEFDAKLTNEKLSSRLAHTPSLILVATMQTRASITDRDKQALVAYKIGYATSGSEFYSWLGGVVSAYRKLGIANQLRDKQEKWASKNGYRYLRVKSMNRFPAMLQLLIANGYRIEGYEDKGTPDNSKILFYKLLCE